MLTLTVHLFIFYISLKQEVVMESVKVGDYISTGFNGDCYPYIVIEVGTHRGRTLLTAISIPNVLHLNDTETIRLFNNPQMHSEERILAPLFTNEEMLEKLIPFKDTLPFVEVASPHHRAKSKTWTKVQGHCWGFFKGFCYSYNPHL